jgi:DNA-directed RNA polymerase subunit RPC12/RpoP
MPGNMARESSPSSAKLAVLVAAGSIGISWFLLAIWLFFMAANLLGVLSGILPTQMPVSLVTVRLFLGTVGLFIFCSFIYLIFAFRIRCPHCGFRFLKNPKGLGPTGFVYHPSCPRKRGINPWAVQVGRFLATQKIRCINCGEEVFG